MSRLIRRIFDRATRKPSSRVRVSRPIHNVADLKARLFLQPLEVRMAPAVFTVTDNSDSVADVNSLRYAIAQANLPANAGTNAINITATGTILLTSTLPTIASGNNLTINGPAGGASQLTISGNGLFRIFNDANNAAGNSFAISGVTLANALTSGAGNLADGAAIDLSLANENLTLTNSVISGCTASSSGGGIYTVAGGSLSITGSTLSNNTAGQSGGAIDFGLTSPTGAGGGTLTINSSQILNNTALEGGGIIDVAGATTITNSTLAGNIASSVGLGGALYLQAYPIQQNYTISNCTIANNTAFFGGAIEEGRGPTGSVGGNLNVTSCTITGNVARTFIGPTAGAQVGNGGAINVHYAPAASYWTDAFDNTVISGNTPSIGSATTTGPDIVDQVQG